MEVVSNQFGLKYAVKSSIPAHSSDVRTVAATKCLENNFVTGSRDTLVKLWVPNTDGYYMEGTVFCGATKYVSSLCALPASEQYPEGLILAGSSDCSIYGFAVNHAEPVMKLLGHSGNVCSLSAGAFGTFVSGSWDKTARVWSGQQCHLVLSGHQEAVWAAEFLPEQNLILTASADHTIRLWCSGKTEKVYKGHTDCVRGLAIVSDKSFLSCSNDCSIRLWDIEGHTLRTYESHTAYVYGIALLSTTDGVDFASCGEDGKIKIWKGGNVDQTLYFPGKTLWSICRASNGNLAVGCSDGTLLVLSEVPGDEIVPEEIMDDVPNEYYPADEFLNHEGSYDGEKIMCFDQESNCMVVYSWKSDVKQWKKMDAASEGVIGGLLDMPHGVKPNEGKVMKFDVDVEGTMFQITYKSGENPWTVAQNFVAEHNLPIDHVSQIADFIIKNSGHSSTVRNTVAESENTIAETRKIIAESKFIAYPKGNISGLSAKLSDFNLKVPKEHHLSEQTLQALVVLTNLPSKVTLEQMCALDSALMWNDEYLFPVLDLVRLAVRSTGMYNKVSNPGFINHLLKVLTETKFWLNRNLIMKIFCNMFGYLEGHETLEKFHEKIFFSVTEALQEKDMRIEKAGSALFLNYAIVCNEGGMHVDLKLYCKSIMGFISSISDSEAINRILLAIFNIIEYNMLAVEYLNSHEMLEILCKLKGLSAPRTIDMIDLLFLRFKGISDNF